MVKVHKIKIFTQNCAAGSNAARWSQEATLCRTSVDQYIYGTVQAKNIGNGKEGYPPSVFIIASSRAATYDLVNCRGCLWNGLRSVLV